MKYYKLSDELREKTMSEISVLLGTDFAKRFQDVDHVKVALGSRRIIYVTETSAYLVTDKDEDSFPGLNKIDRKDLPVFNEDE